MGHRSPKGGDGAKSYQIRQRVRGVKQPSTPSLSLSPSAQASSRCNLYFLMASFASNALRRAPHAALKPSIIASAASRTLPSATRVAIAPLHRSLQRRYVSETKRDNAQVAVETAIKLDKNDFVNIDQASLMASRADPTSAVASPMAGEFFCGCLSAHGTCVLTGLPMF